VLVEADLQFALKNKKSIIHQSFITFFDGAELSGKSLLQVEVINVYVEKLIKNDLKLISNLKLNNQFLTLTKLEQEFSTSLNVSINNAIETIYITGKIDRIDSYNGFVRILDYKNSVQVTDKFVFTDFEQLFLDKDLLTKIIKLIYNLV
jgi:ATP-dependent helicase/DNAse subunit B